MVSRVENLGRRNQKGYAGKVQRGKDAGVKSQGSRSEQLHSVAPNGRRSGLRLKGSARPRVHNGTNLEQESASAEESTKQVLMGESRKQSLVPRG